MLISYKRGQTGVVLRCKLLNSSVSTGAGLTGLTHSSTGLIVSTIADNEATPTVYTVAAGNLETIAALGTHAAPTAGKARFKEVDAVNHKGIYELQLADARFSIAGAKFLLISLSGATNLAETDIVVPLTDLDPYDSLRAGLGALPAAAANTNGGLPVLSGTLLNYQLATVNALANNAVNANALAGDAVTEIQSGLATASALALVAAKTQNLPADPVSQSALTSTLTDIDTKLADVAPIKAVTDDLASMIETDSGEKRFTEKALEMGPSGGGGGGGSGPTVEEIDAHLTERHGAGSWVSSPAAGIVPDAGPVASGTSLTAYHYAPLASNVVSVKDSAGNPVDLTAIADDLAFVVFRMRHGTEWKVGELIGPDISFDPLSPAQVTLLNSTCLNRELGDFVWALRRRTAGEKFVLAAGAYRVLPCADPKGV